jgi:hypothetical protein
MAELTLVTSWDDGHPADRRLADILVRHGIAGTFFVPAVNGEGRPVMTPGDLRALASAGFEIAAHTRDHRRLTDLEPAEVREQIVDGRRRLEDVLGMPVTGFAYPGGHAGRHGRAAAIAAGFAYARGTEMFRLDHGPDQFMLATTMQFHPHGWPALTRNWLRCGGGLGRLDLACRLAGDLDRGLAGLLEIGRRRGGIFHLWSHSWEIDQLGLWPALDRACAALAEAIPPGRRRTVQGSLA